jgi:branched-chain amino acid transport system substrate-binding protein
MAKAIDQAGSTDGDAIREALESLGRHEGLIKTYDKPFSPDNHDALNENDYIMVRFVDKTITPVE